MKNDHKNTDGDLLKEINEIINKITLEDIAANKFKLLCNFIKLLDLRKDEISKVQYFYLTGYAWYCMPIDSVERYNKVAYNLKEALKLEINHTFSNIYLGHLYYDNKEYDKAKVHFEKIDQDYLYNLDQRWRVLKIQELILCCDIGKKGNDCVMDDNLCERIIELIKIYQCEPEEDTALPFEIINAVYKKINLNHCKKNKKCFELVSSINSFILKFDYEDLFEKELLFFRQIVYKKQ